MVSILPEGARISYDIQLKDVIKPSKTYKVDFEKGRIVSLCEGIEAIKQAVYLILNTDRFQYIIYSWNYGNEISRVDRDNRAIFETELKRLLKEALMQDDRINNVDDFNFNYDKDSVTVGFTVFSNLGDFYSEEVIKSV
jgi:hypothetical protein